MVPSPESSRTQWPAVSTVSGATSVPEQNAPLGCPSNFSPGQSFSTSFRSLVLKEMFAPDGLAVLAVNRATEARASVFTSSSASS